MSSLMGHSTVSSVAPEPYLTRAIWSNRDRKSSRFFFYCYAIHGQ